MFRSIFCFGVVIILVLLMAGWGGVWCNAEYSSLLDRTAALSNETAIRASKGLMTENEMAQALRYQADTWSRFKAAREGKE